jgi:uncharacterized protein (DUF924 family)
MRSLAEASWADGVLAFWFEEIEPAAWFERDPVLDATVGARFLAVHESVATHFGLAAATVSPRQAVASAIVLDQFPRNMFRGTPRAFATDRLALAVAREAVARRFDRELDENRRLFLYLPFQHSERLADQQRAVELVADLGDPEWRRYATAHRDIIARFGRFPHRNAILGRSSTPAELDFLKEPGSAF